MIGSLFSKDLVSMKRKALRKRIWFKILNQAERALINLTIRVVDRVRSNDLVKVLLAPIEKLRNVVKSALERAEEIGRPLAEKLVSIARAWGNREAGSWMKDRMFVIYTGLSSLNDSFITFNLGGMN